MDHLGFARSLLAATALVGLSSVAHAQTNFPINPVNPANPLSIAFGGGSTLATPTYVSLYNTYVLADNTLGFNWTGKGSGNSQCALIVNTSSAGAPYTGAQSFVAAAAAGQNVDFVASDATLTAVQIAIYNNGAVNGINTTDLNGNPLTVNAAGATCQYTDPLVANPAFNVNYPVAAPIALGGPLIQLPTFGTPITVPFNISGVRNINGAISLTDDMLCGLFSGQITTFGDARLNGSGLQVASGPNANLTKTVNIVVRSDGSGTSFLLLQHLVGNTGAYPASAATYNPTTNPNGTRPACTPQNSNFYNDAAGGKTFAPNASPNFATAFYNKTLPGAPASFQGGAGSSNSNPAKLGVLQLLQNTPNSLAYLSPDFTKAASVNNSQAVPYVARVRNPVDGIYYVPTVAATSLALGSAAAPATAAEIANPAAYVPGLPNPGRGYPIVGFTTYDFVQCYADAQLGNDLAFFLTDFYTAISFKTAQQANGFSPLPATFANAINNNILNPSPNNVDIESPAKCQAAGASGAGTYPGR